MDWITAIGFIAGLIIGAIGSVVILVASYFKQRDKRKRILQGMKVELTAIDDTLSKTGVSSDGRYATLSSHLLPLTCWTYRGIGWRLAMIVKSDTLTALHETYRMIMNIDRIEEGFGQIRLRVTKEQVHETRKRIEDSIGLLNKELN